MNEIRKFDYEGQVIEFDLQGDSVMVNATEMAKVFNKKVENFTRQDQTKTFIEAALNNADQRFILFEKEEDLIHSVQKSGTWMHRILALKFAAWLNPVFELWVYNTIDQLLFGEYPALQESLKQSAERRDEIDELEKTLQQSDEYQKLERLKLLERQAAYNRGKFNKHQLELFRKS
ncbi:MAG: KilA-N domain-containing protein [Fulvivirga sp.]